MSLKIKICGITNVDDALAATEAGADYLGFIFWPKSKRAVTVETVGQLTSVLRRRESCPTLVGVFVDLSAQEIEEILNRCRLDLAQLSGDEPAWLVGDPQSPLYGRSYKAVRPTTVAEAEAEAEWYVPADPPNGGPSLLLDAYHPTLPGGTGRTADWEMAAELAQSVPRLMLAGGLTPDNVAGAVRRVRPFAVDVASGVEARPGKKDHDLLRAFVERAHSGT